MTKPVDVEGKYVRQSGGKGQYGHCKIHVEPLEPGSGYEFENKIVGGAIPKEYIPSIDVGIQEAAKSGIVGGYEVVDFKVTLVDGSTTKLTPRKWRSRSRVPWQSRAKRSRRAAAFFWSR